MDLRHRLGSDKACNLRIPDIASYRPPRDGAYRGDNKVLVEFDGLRELRYLGYSFAALLSILDRIYNGIFEVNMFMVLHVGILG